MTRSMPLPRRTLDYLAQGAPEGQRNEELLHAGCQCRDAGFSQGEAEQVLIPRAEADGLSTAEARATIASAYRRPARSGNIQPHQLLASSPLLAQTQARDSGPDHGGAELSQGVFLLQDVLAIWYGISKPDFVSPR